MEYSPRTVACQRGGFRRGQSKIGVQIPLPPEATDSFTAPAVPAHLPLPSGRSGPPLCGGTLPATPPCNYAGVSGRFQLAADALRTRRHSACAAPAVRITNHESRVPAVPDVPALPCTGGLSPQRPPCNYASVSGRFQLAAGALRTRRHSACAAPAVRITNHESRQFRTFRTFRPSLVRGDSPRNAPL